MTWRLTWRESMDSMANTMVFSRFEAKNKGRERTGIEPARRQKLPSHRF